MENENSEYETYINFRNIKKTNPWEDHICNSYPGRVLLGKQDVQIYFDDDDGYYACGTSDHSPYQEFFSSTGLIMHEVLHALGRFHVLINVRTLSSSELTFLKELLQCLVSFISFLH